MMDADNYCGGCAKDVAECVCKPAASAGYSGDWAFYHCNACNKNVADPRGWPAFDCNLCGADAGKLEEERQPTQEQMEAFEASCPTL